MKSLKAKAPVHFSLVLASLLFPTASVFAADIKIKTDGENMVFSPAKFSVKAGEKVTLTFSNSSKSMEHNFVLGKIGTADKLAADGIAAGAPSWTPKGPEVIASTAMIKPLGKETITFTAPSEKGDFPFLCSFPGHGAIMRGNMTVK